MMAVDTALPAIQELGNIDRWVNWRLMPNKGRPTKVPVNGAGFPIDIRQSANWRSLRACVTADPAHIGFVLAPPLIGIDLDACRDPETGHIDDWAAAIIDEVCSYTEVSPSSTGVKIIAIADPMPVLRANKLVIEAIDGAKSKQIEVFDRDRYFCITGEYLDGTPDTIEDATEAVERLVYRVNNRFAAGPAGLPPKLAGLLERDPKLADCWRNGTKLGKGSDVTASGLDCSLVIYLCDRLDDNALAEALRVFPHGQIGNGTLKGKAADRRIADLLQMAAERRQGRHKSGGEGRAKATQDEIAIAFTNAHRDRLRYCHTAGAWFEWTGQHWQKDSRQRAFSWTRRVGRDLGFDGKASTCAGAEKFAQSDEAFAVTHEVWDTDPYLLSTPDGVVDLRNGRRRQAAPEDYITKLASVVPANGDCPIWRRFLEESTGGDVGLIRFLQQIAGYCLTGDVSAHALFFVYGPGGNGKSVFLNVLTGILGDYAKTAAMDTFQASRGDRHPTDLAMLAGARLVTASETEEGRQWAEARIKQLTGGDPIAARFMRQDFFEFRPQFKLVIIGNHKPALKNVDDAARRRFNIIPFVRKPATPDPRLEDKLRDEWPTILTWMIEGCLDWQRHGLQRPQSVVDATAEYFDEQDTFGQWLADRCMIDPNVSETSHKLFADWKGFCEHHGIPFGNSRSLGQRLKKSGFVDGKVGGQRGWKGLACKHLSPLDGWADGEAGTEGTGENVNSDHRAGGRAQGTKPANLSHLSTYQNRPSRRSPF